ncbi:hypothetical protein GCM10027418_29340 [Mariniluteicoccus endophyticus]
MIALKRLDLAKSRFSDTPPALRQQLALAMLEDTCAAVSAAVDRTLVVTPVPGLRGLLARHGAEVVADPGGGLNPAYARGAEILAEAGFSRVLAAVADLPALTPAAVWTVLDGCGGTGRWFVRDRPGQGTTMLVADGCALDPRFEDGSADRHAASGAAEVDAPAEASCDVDQVADLAPAAVLGLGPRTGSLWGPGGLATHDTGVVASPTAEGWTVVRSTGSRVSVPARVLGPGLSGLAKGQRVHLALVGDRAHALWL